MKLPGGRTLLIALVIVTEFHLRPTPMLVQGCLPRPGRGPSGKPIFWNFLFGRKDSAGDDDDDDGEDGGGGGSDDDDPDGPSHWTTSDWIQRHNYSLEVHNVTTSDGYRLQLHRLPQPGRRPVLLLHGLFTSSLSWVLMGPGKSLAFLLHDKQYDIWLANLRGSAYGRHHSRLNVTSEDFWNYSFHEQGVYDLPAIIDHIRDGSVFHQVILITHSQGFNAFLALCSDLPDYNEKILFVQALAPIVELKNFTKFKNDQNKIITKHLKAKSQAKSFELFPAGYLRGKCVKGRRSQRAECRKWFKLLAGRGQHSKTLDSLIYGQLLQGGSLKEVQHLQQIWKSGDFVAFDYDPDGNRRHYNSVEPHGYNLSAVTVPMVLHYGASDAIATPTGVHHIYSHLLTDNYILGVYRVNADQFNHFDFLCASDVLNLLNNKIIDIIEKYFNGQLLYVIE